MHYSPVDTNLKGLQGLSDQKGGMVFSTLSVTIEALDRLKEVSSVASAKVVFGSCTHRSTSKMDAVNVDGPRVLDRSSA